MTILITFLSDFDILSSFLVLDIVLLYVSIWVQKCLRESCFAVVFRQRKLTRVAFSDTFAQFCFFLELHSLDTNDVNAEITLLTHQLSSLLLCVAKLIKESALTFWLEIMIAEISSRAGSEKWPACFSLSKLHSR